MTGTNSQFRDLSFLDELPGHAAVFDLIYSPAETELLRQARLRGLKAANGLGMLIYQAVFALEYFAGVRIDAKEMGTARDRGLRPGRERHKNGPRGKETPFPPGTVSLGRRSFPASYGNTDKIKRENHNEAGCAGITYVVG